ncbi:MAG: SLBB domain-containing protein, partial [Planctomycetota bacterium]
GGPLRRGSLRRISVTEPGSDSRVIDLYALAAGETAEPLQSLRPQSVIMVPLAGPHVQVFGEVRRSYTFELAPEASLAQVLELAGGLTSAADPDRIRLLREDRHGQDLQLLAMAQLAEVTVRDGDRLHIGRKASLDNSYNSVRVEGQVRSGGTYPIAADMTLSEALRLAGGMTPKADVEKIFIIRNLTEPAQLQLNDDVDLAVYQDLVTNAKPDTVLLPLDTIVVPAKPELSRATLTVQINGAIQHPGYYPLLPEMNAADLIRMAGGVRASAQVDEADLIRLKRIGEARTVERMAVDLRPILNDQTEGPLLRNGDTLVVRSTSEERISVSLEGEITNTGEFVFPAGTTLGQALAIAGGLTEWAFPAGARFFRASEAEVAEEQLDNLMRQLQQSKAVNESLLNNATDPSGRAALERTIVNQQIELERMQRAQATGRMTGVDVRGILALAPGTDFTLQEGDRLSIPMRPGTIRVLGEVMTPGSLRFEEGLQVRDVVRRAGGMSQQADEDRVFVIRADGTVVASAAYSGTAWDPAERRWVRTDIERITLLEGDTVLVPPDLEYRISGMQLAKDWSQILFQVAATVGTIAVIGN